MVDVAQELEALRQNLLDLSLRNNLLNYRPSQRRTISITGKTPAEIYEIFVLQEKSMKFRAKKGSGKCKKSGNGGAGEDAGPEEESKLFKTIGKIFTPDEKSRPPSSRFEPFLDVPEDSEALERKLFYVHNQANSIFEEQGYPVLYLALGFLQWGDSRSSVKNPKAPLVLVPVELKRIGKGRKFSLQWTGDEIFTSITLQAKMKELGIELPEFEMPEEGAGIDSYLEDVLKAIAEKPGWKVLPEVCIDFFNFRKFVMYKDLDSATWPEDMSPAEHPLVQRIFNPTDPESVEAGFLEEDVDLKLSAKDSYHILDADSSQIAVIEDVKSGMDLVVEGPPGTGKSQTIANTIAELLALGRSVLFVSEKMAALQVVKSRLDAAGLGDLCLEIHSHKTRKKAVLEELAKTLNRSAPAAINPERDINELEKLKKELNEYAKTLGEPEGQLYSSLYTLYGVREKTRAYFEAKDRKMPGLKFEETENWSLDAWTEAESVLEKLGQVLPVLGPVRKNPWYGCEPGLVLPQDCEELEPFAGKCAETFEALEKVVKALNDLSGTSKPASLKGFSDVGNAAKLVAASKPLDKKMLENREWESESSRAEAGALVSKLRQYRELHSFVEKTFYPSVFELDTSEFEELSHGLLKFLNPKYRKLKKEISACYAFEAPSKDSQVLLDLSCLSECETRKYELEAAGAKGKKFFGEYWKGFESDPALLEEYGRWIIPFRKYVAEGVFTDKVFGLVTAGVEAGEFEPALEAVFETKKAFIEALGNFGSRIGADFGKMFGKELEEVSLRTLKSRISRWGNETSSLVFWSQYLGYRKAGLGTLAAPMVEDLEAGKIEPEDMIPVFEGNYAEILLHQAFKKRPTLSTFIRELHEGRINKFTELDRKVLLENRKRIIHSAYEDTPKLTSGASRASEAGILLNEFNRKRGHMPIRTLMTKAGGLVQKIKPCFMMSPLSISQYLDPRSTRFDVIIFDEASQVRPEDAVGALLRGNQVVVMGDSKQLPPTAFFDTVIDTPETEPDDYGTAGDMESILNVCKRGFPIKTLRWHYRSRHESLIAVSNQEFYDNRLYVYPSPMQKDERLGLKFMHLPDAVYDRGKSGANRVEAKAVARAVFEHVVKYPDKSLGVGTFNVKQQEAIQEEIEVLIKANPGIDLNSGTREGEHFFVKNLETIQGDERDVILLSVGFGFDGNRKLSLNFGPLNREGGERRLNVLITRAREKCVVFANFTSRDLHLDENSSFGLRALKVFLEFAENGRLPTPAGSEEEFDSPFEETVSDFLRENGFEIHRQIGCAGYRLDLAVPDPRYPGRYLLGIECDGASYHSSPVARDRDRLRQQVLEGLGWNLYRVWSTDWYLRPKESKAALLEVVQKEFEAAKMEVGDVFEPVEFIDPGAEEESVAEPDLGTESTSTAQLEAGTSSGAEMENEIKPESEESPELRSNEDTSETRNNKGQRTITRVGEEPLYFAGERAEEDSDVSGLELENDEAVGGDFLPELTSKAEAIAPLTSETSKTRSPRKSGKSKLLKFEAENECDPDDVSGKGAKFVPEPDFEKLNFFEASPEIDPIDWSGARGKKIRKPFVYNFGSPEDMGLEPDVDSEPVSGSEPYSDTEPVSGPEPGAEPELSGLESEFEPEKRFETGERVEFETEIKAEIEAPGFPGPEYRARPEPELEPEPGFELETDFGPETEPENGSEFLSYEYEVLDTGESDKVSPDKGNGSKLPVDNEDSLETRVPVYTVCTAFGLSESCGILDISAEELEAVVVKIVDCEGPVHVEELLQRIKIQCKIPRMLGKIKQSILDAVTSAEMAERLRVKGDFLWPVSEPAYLLRRRDGDTPPKIEWICDEEIREAVRFVLDNQYSTPLDDLVIQASRVLGIKITRKNARDRIESLIRSGIESNELTRMPNEMIYFAE